jgi:type IV secretory pathway TraG/TraD family ATPase VirD4
MGRLYSSICGSETITRQQKNTSFGANEFRDGVSYNEQQQEKPLVKLEDFALLGLGECYTLLPEPAVRLSRMKTPEARVLDKNQGFVEKEEELKATNTLSLWQDEQNELASNAAIRESNLVISNEIMPNLQEEHDLDIDENNLEK